MNTLRRAIPALMIVVGTLLATTASASATTVLCGDNAGSANCIEMTQRSNGTYEFYIGIDIAMSRTDAEAILAWPGQEVWASMMGVDDPAGDNHLLYLPLQQAWATDHGISAEFHDIVDGSLLNEDFFGEDEVRGRVRVWDPRQNAYILTFHTKTIHHSFPG